MLNVNGYWCSVILLYVALNEDVNQEVQTWSSVCRRGHLVITIIVRLLWPKCTRFIYINFWVFDIVFHIPMDVNLHIQIECSVYCWFNSLEGLEIKWRKLKATELWSQDCNSLPFNFVGENIYLLDTSHLKLLCTHLQSFFEQTRHFYLLLLLVAYQWCCTTLPWQVISGITAFTTCVNWK